MRRSLGMLLNSFLELGHLFSHLCEGIPTNSLCLTSSLQWCFLAPLGLEGTILLVLGTLASIVCTSCAPMLLAHVAMFLNASFFWNLVSGKISVLAFPILLRVSRWLRVSLFPLEGLLGMVELVLSFSMFSRRVRSQHVSWGIVFWFRSYWFCQCTGHICRSCTTSCASV